MITTCEPGAEPQQCAALPGRRRFDPTRNIDGEVGNESRRTSRVFFPTETRPKLLLTPTEFTAKQRLSRNAMSKLDRHLIGEGFARDAFRPS